MPDLHLWSTVIASFLGSFVEFVEALTIVLAVGVVSGWRAALGGAAAAAGVLALLIAIFGHRLAEWNVPAFKIVLGTLLLLFGLRWLRKAVLRAGGVLKLHDEAAAFEEETKELRARAHGEGFDTGAFLTAFNGVFIEGVEVVFIVLALGIGAAKLSQAVVGASSAAGLVILLGVVARKPLTAIPENLLKFAVGILIASFGTFFTGEGLEIRWPGGDFALLGLTLAYTACAVVGVRIARLARARQEVTAS